MTIKEIIEEKADKIAWGISYQKYGESEDLQGNLYQILLSHAFLGVYPCINLLSSEVIERAEELFDTQYHDMLDKFKVDEALEGAKIGDIVAFKPKKCKEGEVVWFTAHIRDIYEPRSKYNEKDTFSVGLDVILPVFPQWEEDGDKTNYYRSEIEELVILESI